LGLVCVLFAHCTAGLVALERVVPSQKVLIISKRVLFIEAVTRLLATEEIVVAAKAETLPEVGELLASTPIDAIVVDYDEVHWPETEVVDKLARTIANYCLIFLTQTENQMILHYRKRIENVTPADVLQAFSFAE
jgi:DNA-binding NarL/FixJ family response regulator